MLPSRKELLSSFSLRAQLMSSIAEMRQILSEINDEMIAKHLAGQLDPEGHTVEVVQKAIGNEIRTFLVIDGEG